MVRQLLLLHTIQQWHNMLKELSQFLMGELVMNKKFYLVISVLLMICCLFNGCDDGGNNSNKKNGSNMIQRNILKEEYDEQYNHYEDSLYVAKKCSKIIVTGNVTSGTIKLKITEKDGDTDKNTYTYTIEGSINEIINLEKKHSTDWVAIVDYNEDTEGTYTVKSDET